MLFGKKKSYFVDVDDQRLKIPNDHESSFVFIFNVSTQLQLRQLETQKRQQELILRRKNEEVRHWFGNESVDNIFILFILLCAELVTVC